MAILKWNISRQFLCTTLFLLSLGLLIIVSLIFMPSRSEQPVLKEVVVQNATENVPKDRTVRFAAVGDFGASANAQSVLDTIASQKPNFTLALGDLSYGEVSEKVWCGLVHDTLGPEHPFEIVAGNHDTDVVTVGSSKGHIYDFATCLPNRMPTMRGDYGLNYYFDYQDLLRTVMISPDIQLAGKEFTFTKGQADYEWLKGVIEDARSKSISWVVVGMHKNCITLGEKTCEIGTDLLNLLSEQHVDLVLQGHEHGYFRTKQLVVNAACPSLQPNGYKNECVREGTEDKQYKKGEGTLLAIAGTGGTELRDLNLSRPDKDYFAAWSGKNVDPAFGPLIVEVKKERLFAYFLGIDTKKHDVFTVTEQ